MNTTMAVRRMVPCMASHNSDRLKRLCKAARINAPTTPMAPASVGVATACSWKGRPPIEPSTVKIRMAEGMMPLRHLRHSGQPFSVRASSGTPGT